MCGVQCIIEVRPLVRSLAFYVTNCPNDEPDIKIEDCQLSVLWKDQPSLTLELPYKLLPDSLKGISTSDDGVSFCIRTEDIEPAGGAMRLERHNLQLAIGEDYNLRCSKCQTDLNTDLIAFKLIFPLPSNRWKSASSDWFCHKSKEDLMPRKLMEPKPHYCLTDPFYKLVHRSLVDFSKVSEKDGEVVCNHCSQVIGLEQGEETVLIWNERVSWRCKNGISCHGESVDFLMFYLSGAVKKGIGLPTKVLLVTKDEPKEYLYIWVIDKSLLLLKNCCVVEKGLLQPPTQTFPVGGSDAVKISGLSEQILYKVLYCFCEMSEKVNSWKNDDLVEELVINREGMKAICGYLDSTGLLIPKAERVSHEFYVGYLPKI